MNTMSLILGESHDVYHSHSGREFLTSHLLATFRRCPLLYKRMVDGEIQRVDSPAFRFGRAAHTLILEGLDAFYATYEVGGPVNPKTGRPFGPDTQACRAYMAATGKQLVGEDEWLMLDAMAHAVRHHPHAADLLATCGRYWAAEVTVRQHCDGVACQVRLDALSGEHGIIELKTCADLDRFERDAREYKYAHQVAFYDAVLQVATGEQMQCWLIAVEKQQPYRVGIWEVRRHVLLDAAAENRVGIQLLKDCHRDQIWPTGYEDIRLLTM